MATNESPNQDYLEANRALWNRRTPIHLQSEFYDVASVEAGGSSLRGPALTEFAPRVAGKSVLHLQCHFGLDTLSLARFGAQATGVDFSDTAIEEARRLSDRLALPADFLCESVLKLDASLNRQFDFVFTSYGVLGWLPDLDRWAEVIHTALKPGGTFYMVEFHPAFQQRDDDGALKYAYFPSTTPDHEVAEKTYTDGAGHEPLSEYWWNHPVSSPIDALVSAGLQLTLFREYDYSPYCLSDAMTEVAPQQWAHPDLHGKLPYLFAVEAGK